MYGVHVFGIKVSPECVCHKQINKSPHQEEPPDDIQVQRSHGNSESRAFPISKTASFRGSRVTWVLICLVEKGRMKSASTYVKTCHEPNMKQLWNNMGEKNMNRQHEPLTMH